MIRVLFVCLGNICRSPTAEGVFRHRLAEQGLGDKIETDSAGTAGYHIGKCPDRRSQAAALRRGVDIADLRARQVAPSDFGRFDWILAMDRANYEDLLALCPAEYRSRVRLFLDFAEERPEDEVPDPYYGGEHGFEHVLDLVQEASDGFLAYLREQGRV